MIDRLRIPMLLMAVALAGSWAADAQEVPPTPKIALSRAVMCEAIEAYTPVHPAVVFSIARGKISCFTTFDPVHEQTTVHHKWFRRDELVTVKRLTVKPPRWSTFTSMQLRDADKGPWRVDITDDNDRLLDTLRFSITD